jgi:hypothetical protein
VNTIVRLGITLRVPQARLFRKLYMLYSSAEVLLLLLLLYPNTGDERLCIFLLTYLPLPLLLIFISCHSIDWQYDPETKIITVDQYETTRPPRRSNFEMVLPRDIRQSMLKKEWDVSQGQIAAAVRANIKVKNQRRSTVNNLGKATRMEEMMESAGKKVFGGLMFKKSTNRQVQELEQQVEDAQKLRSQAKLEMQMSGEYDDVDSEMNEDKSTQSTIGDA